MQISILCLVFTIFIFLLLLRNETFRFSNSYIQQQGYRGVVYPNTYVEAETTFGKAYNWANNIQTAQNQQTIDVRNLKNTQLSELDKNKMIWALEQQKNAYNAMLPYYSPEIIDQPSTLFGSEGQNVEEKEEIGTKTPIIESFDIGLPIYLGGRK